MFNDIVIGPITIHMYGVMIAAGFLAALLMTLRRGKKRGYDEDIIWGIFFCAIIGGMLGTRILYYIVEIPEIMKDPSILWDFKNGYVVYGGIIGGILASYIYCRTKKQAFITFHNSSFAPNGVKLIPTQLISAAGDFIICALLLWFASKRPKAGRVAAAYLVLYGIGRFAVEFLRNDYRGSVGVLSTSQLISIGAVIGGIVLYFAAPKLAGVGNVAEEKSVG